MTEQDINEIYDRLYNIAPRLEIRSIPNPRYISEKLGECHMCMDEVSKFYIKTNKELSVLKRAFNNADVAFSIAKDDLITNDEEIYSLPNQKDRESKANNKLKDKINELKAYKNEIDCLETLRDTIQVKLKDLTRLNADIKSQLRVMEAQIKLGTGGVETEKSLMDELKKTALGKDVWEGVESTVTEESIVDPSAPIDPNKLLSSEDPFAQLENIVEQEISNHPAIEEISISETVPEQVTDTELVLDVVNNPSIPEEASVSEQALMDLISDTVNNLSVQNASPEESKVSEVIVSDVDKGITAPEAEKPPIKDPVPDELVFENEEANNEANDEDDRENFVKFIPEDDVFGSDVITSADDDIKPEMELDLDKILDLNPNPSSNPNLGGEPEVIIKEDPKIKVESEPEKTQEPVKQNTNEISFFDDLLAQFK